MSIKIFARDILIFIVRFYRHGIAANKAVAFFAPLPCRFYPSCSVFAEEAISRYGIKKGSIKAVQRLLRCRPFGKSGYDPVD